jgi:hypothetical protein
MGMLLETAIPANMTTPINDMTLSAMPQQQREDCVGDARRERQPADCGIHEGRELRYEDKRQRQDGMRQADGETVKAGDHALE